MKRLLSKAHAAKIAGVDRAVITRKTKEGEELFPCVVDGKIDVGHPAFVFFLEKRNVDPTAIPSATVGRHDVDGFPDDGSPQMAVDIQELTLREIGERYGSATEFHDHLKAIKLAEEIREKRLKNDNTDSSMIDRELVSGVIFAIVDETNRRILSDFPKSVVRTIVAGVKSGLTIEELEKEVRSMASRIIAPEKQRVSRALRDAAARGDESPILEN